MNLLFLRGGIFVDAALSGGFEPKHPVFFVSRISPASEAAIAAISNN